MTFRNIRARLALVPGAALGAMASAHAALPAGVETAITDYKADAGTAIGFVIGAGVVIWGLRKLGQKMGWI